LRERCAVSSMTDSTAGTQNLGRRRLFAAAGPRQADENERARAHGRSDLRPSDSHGWRHHRRRCCRWSPRAPPRHRPRRRCDRPKNRLGEVRPASLPTPAAGPVHSGRQWRLPLRNPMVAKRDRFSGSAWGRDGIFAASISKVWMWRCRDHWHFADSQHLKALSAWSCHAAFAKSRSLSAGSRCPTTARTSPDKHNQSDWERLIRTRVRKGSNFHVRQRCRRAEF
jgi:hypothetical protein